MINETLFKQLDNAFIEMDQAIKSLLTYAGELLVLEGYDGTKTASLFINEGDYSEYLKAKKERASVLKTLEKLNSLTVRVTEAWLWDFREMRFCSSVGIRRKAVFGTERELFLEIPPLIVEYLLNLRPQQYIYSKSIEEMREC